MSFVQRMRLRAKFTSASLILVAIFASSIAFVNHSSKKVAIQGPLYSTLANGKDLIADVLPPPNFIIEAHLLAHEYANAKDIESRDQFLKEYLRCEQQYQERIKYWQNYLPPGELRDAFLSGSHPIVEEYFEVFHHELMPAVDAGEFTRANEIADIKLSGIYDRHRAAVDRVVEHATAYNSQVEQQAQSEIYTFGLTSLAIVVCAGLGSLGLSWWFGSSLCQRISKAQEVAKAIGAGAFDRRATVHGEDEVDQLANEMNRAAEMLEQSVGRERQRNEEDHRRSEDVQHRVSVILDIVNAVADGKFDVEVPALGTDPVGQVADALKKAVEAMRHALINVQGVAKIVATASTQLNSATQEISASSQEQASSLEETASSLEQITSAVKHNSDNAQQARQLAVSSRDVAEKGGRVVSTAVEAMEAISQSSTRIVNIITAIDEIAFQTNLLALNAAVEAARAGEQGRGFAVVAAEVRNLAQRSASAAKEIKTLIQDSSAKVVHGTELVNQSGATLQEIVESVKRVTDIISEIAAASKEQLTGIEQVNKAVLQMDRATQSSASQTEELAETADSLHHHAEQLQQLANRFELGETKTDLVTSAIQSSERTAGRKRNRLPEKAVSFPSIDMPTATPATIEF